MSHSAAEHDLPEAPVAVADSVAGWRRVMATTSDEIVRDVLRRAAADLFGTRKTNKSDGQLVGYFLWFLIRHPHYAHVSVAEEDLHFLLWEHRRGLAGYKFVKAACQAAFDHGAELLVLREKVGHEHTAIMKRLGFVPTDIVYTRARG
jgi:hypothetical protein